MKASTVLAVAREGLMRRGYSCMEIGEGEGGPLAFDVVEGGETFTLSAGGGPAIEPGKTVRTPEDVEGETAEVLALHTIEGEPHAWLRTDAGQNPVVPVKELVGEG